MAARIIYFNVRSADQRLDNSLNIHGKYDHSINQLSGQCFYKSRVDNDSCYRTATDYANWIKHLPNFFTTQIEQRYKNKYHRQSNKYALFAIP